MKKKSRSFEKLEELTEVNLKAKKTVEILTKNMISGEVTLAKMFEFYSEVTRKNTIKLLLRSKKLYEARVDVKAILLSII
mmetsp:Transcript_21117/g.20298  ORF Transcript_21117/g.20298 Transcript_21117/m.20298 type:complete len:80 (+) Transcript_21117:791-1030(+)